MSAPAPLPLAGARVLEVASLFAAPLMGAMLGDLGADVVKVEPAGGDQLRILSADRDRPGPWTYQSRNKRMITLDTGDPEGLGLLHRLTAAADVVTFNHPPSLLEKLGCTYQEVAARNPGAIVVNTSAFGPEGPYADRTGNGSIAEAFGGLTDLNRSGETGPSLTPVLFGDHLTATAGVAGILAALYWRDARGGGGQFIDLTMYEPVLGLLGPQLVGLGSDEEKTEPPRSGLRGTFRTGDGRWVVATAYSDAQIRRLLEAVGVDAEGPRDLPTLAAQWISTQDRDQVVAALAAARIQVAPVNSLDQVADDPQVRLRDSLVEVEDSSGRRLTFPRPAPRLGTTPATIRWADRPTGADTEAVLAEWLSTRPRYHGGEATPRGEGIGDDG
ncbi:MAG TPA: CoA transferase [Acidimicrobiales bacterium]|nr:CoA transferase [Acidimicrobiales bacterium]